MLNQLIDRVFGDLDAAHRHHASSVSELERRALGEFCRDVVGRVDDLINSAYALDLPLPDRPEGDALTRLEAGYIELTGMRDDFCQGDRALELRYDSLCGSYLVTIARLKRGAKVVEEGAGA